MSLSRSNTAKSIGAASAAVLTTLPFLSTYSPKSFIALPRPFIFLPRPKKPVSGPNITVLYCSKIPAVDRSNALTTSGGRISSNILNSILVLSAEAAIVALIFGMYLSSASEIMGSLKIAAYLLN